MSEPRRLLTDTETSPLGRSLLAAGRARREPEGARERVWSAVAVGLAGSAGTGTGTGTGGASAAARVKGVSLSLAQLKLILAGAVLVTVAGAAVVATSRDVPATAVHVAAPPAPSPAPVPGEPSVPAPAPAAEARMTGVPRTEAFRIATLKPIEGERAPRVPTSTLREEVALLQHARAALARGDTVTARAKLDDARTRFPNSQLGEERDALEVRVASASGDRARAASLSRAFVEHYPDSPLRAGVESIGRGPEKL